MEQPASESVVGWELPAAWEVAAPAAAQGPSKPLLTRSGSPTAQLAGQRLFQAGPFHRHIAAIPQTANGPATHLAARRRRPA